MITLHEAFVPTALQLLGSLNGLLAKAEAHCREQEVASETLISARLAPDMLDFAYQVKSCAVHSFGAIEGVRQGNFSPDTSPPPSSFAELRERVDSAIAGLEGVTADELEALQDKMMTFTMRDVIRWDFTAKNFLLSFSQPNFHFHVTAAYAVLRSAGLRIGKGDYLGALRKA